MFEVVLEKLPLELPQKLTWGGPRVFAELPVCPVSYLLNQKVWNRSLCIFCSVFL